MRRQGYNMLNNTIELSHRNEQAPDKEDKVLWTSTSDTSMFARISNILSVYFVSVPT